MSRRDRLKQGSEAKERVLSGTYSKPRDTVSTPSRRDRIKQEPNLLRTTGTPFAPTRDNIAARLAPAPEKLVPLPSPGNILKADVTRFKPATPVETIQSNFEERIAANRAATEGKPIQSFVNRLLEPITALGAITQKPAEAIQPYYTPGAGLGAITAGTQAAGNLISRIAPAIGRGTGVIPTIARGVITEGMVGAPLAAGQALAQDPGISGKEFAKQTAIGAGLGALGGAVPGVGAAIGKGVSMARNAPQDVLRGAIQAAKTASQPRVASTVSGSSRKAKLIAKSEAITPKPEQAFDDMMNFPQPTKAEQAIPDHLDVEDIIPPAAEEVAPRVRDRLNSYADEMLAAARAELRASGSRLSSNPLDIYSKYAAGLMLKGTVKLADVTEQLVKDFGEAIRPHARKIFAQAKLQYKDARRVIEAEELGTTNLNASQLKDLTNINLITADYHRNFRKVFGKDFEPIKKAILDPFEESKGAYAQTQKDLTSKLMRDVVRDLGIRKGSKESALVQQFGEGQITLDELKKASPDKYENIVRADAWFRGEYNKLIGEVNQSIAQIYPNNPDKLVPMRKDYYRHFQEMNAWSGLKNLFDTASARISPSLAGISPFTTPKTKWASFKQKRGLGEFKNDAVGGFLNYIPAAAYAKHIDPHISVFRNLGRRLAAETETSANINNFIKYLNDFSNDLAGKTGILDRAIDDLGGRKTLQTVTKINNRIKTNTILGNFGSIVAQTASMPQTLAYGGRDAIPGLATTTKSMLGIPNEAMAKSNFMKERYLDKSFRQFDQRWWEQPKRAAEVALELGDRVGASFAWNTAYAKGIREGVENPVKYADLEARRILAGRGVGEAPLLMKSKVFNLVAPFQLEVANSWRVMKDFVDAKQFGKLAMLLIYNNIINHIAEQVRGSGITFDPIDALWEAATADDISMLQRGGRLGGEVLSNMPLGSTVAAMYPEYGGQAFGVGADLPSREALFGEKDPTRFGTGLLAAKGLQDPLFKLLPSFGGAQIKKTAQGLDAIVRGGAYTKNVTNTGLEIEEPKLKFPVKLTATNIAQAALFGPYATKEGRAYAKEEGRPLSEKQTQQYQRSSDKKAYYESLQKKRKAEAEKRKQEKK